MDNNLTISQDTELFMNKPLTNIEDEYITEHEAKMYHVLDELLYTTNNVYCGNDMCEKEICKHDSIEDEFMDIFMGGNFYDNNIQMGRMDSDYGTVLINKGNCNFEKAFTPELIMKGQVRKVDKLKIKDRDLILVGLNNDSLKIFEVQSKYEEYNN